MNALFLLLALSCNSLEAEECASTEAVLIVEIVGGGHGVGVLDLVRRRNGGSAFVIDEEDGVAETKHDAVGAGLANLSRRRDLGNKCCPSKF